MSFHLIQVIIKPLWFTNISHFKQDENKYLTTNTGPLFTLKTRN